MKIDTMDCVSAAVADSIVMAPTFNAVLHPVAPAIRSEKILKEWVAHYNKGRLSP